MVGSWRMPLPSHNAFQITNLTRSNNNRSSINVYYLYLQQTLDPKWERYACGKTKDQLFMTQLAHMILKKTTIKPRSLNFFKN